MKAFTFNLARLERLRERDERTARRQLADTAAEVRRLEEAIALVDANIAVCDADRGPLGRAMVSGLNGRRSVLEDELVVAHRVHDGALTRYRERRRDVQALTRLRERRHQQWRLEMEREEQRQTDEMTSVRYALAAMKEQRR